MAMKCKYCGSEMDLMEDNINYQHWLCMNEDCNGSLSMSVGYEDYWDADDKL